MTLTKAPLCLESLGSEFFLQDEDGAGLVPRPREASCKARGHSSVPLPEQTAQSSVTAPCRSIRMLLWLSGLGSIALVVWAVVAGLLGD